MKKLFTIGTLFLFVALFTSCKKDFPLPPKFESPKNSGSITIDSIVKKYIKYYVTTTVQPTSFFRFPDDVNLTCTVTADEISGNLYKQVFVEDGTGGLEIKLLNGYGLNRGDKIRINLNGVLLSNYGDMVLLDSIDIDKRVEKISSGNTVTPVKITFNQAKTFANGISKFQSRLVRLDSVEFIANDKGRSYADTSIYKYTLERTLVNPTGTPIIVRTSGYSNFAKTLTPCGKGSVTGILTQYGTTIQFTLRDINDVNLSSGGCPMQIKNFDDNSIASGGWTNFNVNGNINWTAATYNGQQYGNISNYVAGSNVLCETWLISPAYDISSAPAPKLQFQSAYSYSGPTLQVLVSTNYTSGNPLAATWGTLSPNLSPGSFAWTNSGNVSLGAYLSSNTRIAFKYTGTASAGSTWEVDDIAIFRE